MYVIVEMKLFVLVEVFCCFWNEKFYLFIDFGVVCYLFVYIKGFGVDFWYILEIGFMIVDKGVWCFDGV